MSSEAFPDIAKIEYEGPGSKNPLSFKHYKADEIIGDKAMKDHFRFSMAYWHAMRNPLADPFGGGTAERPWDDGTDSVKNAQNRARVAFEFFEKLGAPYYAFHDRDVAPEGRTLAQSNKNLDAVVKVLKVSCPLAPRITLLALITAELFPLQALDPRSPATKVGMPRASELRTSALGPAAKAVP